VNEKPALSLQSGNNRHKSGIEFLHDDQDVETFHLLRLQEKPGGIFVVEPVDLFDNRIDPPLPLSEILFARCNLTESHFYFSIPTISCCEFDTPLQIHERLSEYLSSQKIQ